MATNPKHLNKLAPTAPKPLTDEEKAQQIARFFAQKREQLFQGILFNLLQNPGCVHAQKVTVKADGVERQTYNTIDIVDEAIAAADYALEKLYPVKQEESK